MSAPHIEAVQLLDGRYRVAECIGEGGMARVFRAEDVLLGRTVAVKLMRPGHDGGSSWESARSEMAVLASLNHPSLVTLLDANLLPDRQPYLVMEFVDGPTLSERLAEGPMSPGDVGEIAVEVSEALHVVHSAGIVHRDVKPSNVLLCPPEFPGGRLHSKLADFGIAYLLADADATAPHGIVGTAAYIAPEQVQGAPPAPPADVYALGLVLLEALTGERPYPHAAGIAAAIARVNAPPEIPDTVDPEWAHLLGRMLLTDPAMRPTALEVAQVAKALCIRARRAAASSDEQDPDSVLAALFGDAAGLDSVPDDDDDTRTRPLPLPLLGAGAHVAAPTAAARRARGAIVGGLAAAALAVVTVFGVGAALTPAGTGSPGPAAPAAVVEEPPSILTDDSADEPVTDTVDAPADTGPAQGTVDPAVAPQPAPDDSLTAQEQRKADHEQHVQEARERGAEGKGQNGNGPNR